MGNADAVALRWRRLLSQVAVVAALWAALLLGAALLWAGSGVWEHLRETGWELWLATAGIFAVSHLLRYVRWHGMLWVEGHPLPVTRGLSIFLAGLALLPTPGKAGVAVRSLLLLREGVPVNVSLAAYFAERLFDLLGLLVLAAMLFAGASESERWLAALGVGAAGIGAVVAVPRACAWASLRARDGGISKRFLAWAGRFFAHTAELVTGRMFAPFLLLGMAANALTGLLLWLAVARFGAALSLPDAVGIVAVSQLSGSLSLLPGGLGGFELAMLGQLSMYGIPAALAIAALGLVRIATIWGSVAVGLPLLLADVRRPDAGPS